jgi:hypothetical protein
MKAIYLILFLLTLPVITFSQDPGKDAVVSPVKMNVLYRGLANPIEIAVPGITSDKITAEVTNGTISKVSTGWVVAPGDQKVSVVTVLVNNKKVSEKTFRIKNVPDPTAVFAGKNEGFITKSTALNTDSIEVELLNFDWDLRFKVKSFVFFCTDGKSDFEETATGNKITTKMRALLAERKEGQKIIFKDIKSVGPEGRTRDLSPIILTLK